MKPVLLEYRDSLHRWLRGDDPAVGEHGVSRTINLARLVLIVGLVFLHYQQFPNSDVTPFDGFDPLRHPLPTFVNSFMLFFFFSAVPLLSIISGWLFFSFSDSDAGAALRKRIQRRTRTLYLPLVVWNATFMLVLWLLFTRFPEYPLFAGLNIDMAGAGVMDWINSVFAVTARPVGYQFWFIRDLFVTVLVSPLLWWALRRSPWATLVLLGGLWLSGKGLGIFFRPDVVFFFTVGGFLRRHRWPLDIGSRATWMLMALYLVLIGLRTLAPAAIEMEHPRPEWLTLATRLTRLVGVLAVWGMLLRFASTGLGEALSQYGGLSFFLYAAHYPLIAWFKIVLWQWVPAQTQGWMLLHLFGSVGLTVMVALSTAAVLARVAPGGFALMNGGRIALGHRAPSHPRPVTARGPVSPQA